jgi:uncharacterized tellurite resistance protein B-like protein
MTPLENLHTAIGEMAYAIATADGSMQKEERKKFHDIVAAELRCKDYDFDISDIIFQILEKDKTDTHTSYDWAIKEIKMNSQYLSPQLKETFIKVIEKVAKAYSPMTIKEKNLLERFKEDIATINGDPVYYNSKTMH